MTYVGIIFGFAAYLYFLYSFTAFTIFFTNLQDQIPLLQNVFPWKVDSPESPPKSVELAVMSNTLWIALFGLTHTVMARNSFKKIITQVLPNYLERSFYVLIAAAELHLVVAQWKPIYVTIWQVPDNLAPFFTAVALAGSFLGVVVCSFLIDHFDLFGLSRVIKGMTYKYHMDFSAPGPYRWLRHPMMLGMLFLVWSAPIMTVGHLIASGLFTLYILIGTHYEERSLQAEFPENYNQYKREVPYKFIPGIL